MGILGDDRFATTPDGRRLHTMTSGSGADLVVLEAGMGASGLYWAAVVDLLAPHARVVAYERAGLGASDPATDRRDLAHLAADLEAVLESALESHPAQRVFLVGHSWGGPIVRTLAARRLRQARLIDGLVLVDQSDEHADLYFAPLYRAQFAVGSAVLVPLSRTGLLRRTLRPLTAGLSPERAGAVIDASATPAAARAAAAEMRQLQAGLRSLLAAPPVLGDLPVRVLSGLRPDSRAEIPVRRALVAAHTRTTERLTGAVQVRTENSGHLIPLSEPELVAAQVRALLSR